MSREAISADEVLRRARSVGQYYGFTPFSELATSKRGQGKKTDLPKELSGITLDANAEVFASFLKQCVSSGLEPTPRTPIFTWHTNITPGRAAPRNIVVQFHAIGADRAIADAVVIRAVRALAHDLFKEMPVVRINTMGDKETRARFARELGVFFKKRSALPPETCGLSENCLACAKNDVFEAAALASEQLCATDLPAPTDQLSDASRKRFEELLEFLEMTETPYELARELISRGSAWSETCFELTHEGKQVAWGSRYNDLAKMFFRTPLSSSGAILRIQGTGGKVTQPRKETRPRFAFVHIGTEAKQASFALAEELRHARVPLVQNVGLESLTEQMHFVEKLNPPYLIIMGRKEALEHSAVLRNRETQQETILPIDSFTERLKAVV